MSVEKPSQCIKVSNIPVTNSLHLLAISNAFDSCCISNAFDSPFQQESNAFEIANKRREFVAEILGTLMHLEGFSRNDGRRLVAEFAAHQTSWPIAKIKRNSATMHSYK